MPQTERLTAKKVRQFIEKKLAEIVSKSDEQDFIINEKIVEKEFQEPLAVMSVKKKGGRIKKKKKATLTA